MGAAELAASLAMWVDKLAHFLAFFAFAALASAAWGARGRARLAWAVLALAVGTEALQQLTEDRGARLSDVGIDLAGAALGVALVGAIGARKRAAG